VNGELRSIPLEKLAEYPGNPRRGNVDAIATSLQANGQFAPIVVRGSDYTVLSGNHTLQAARAIGLEALDAWVVEADEDRSRRIVLAANRTASLGSYDEGALLELLESVDDLGGTGYSDDDLGDLLASIEEHVEPDAPAPRDPAERPDPGQRMLVLDLTVEGYLWVQDGLREVCDRFGVASNVSAVVELLKADLGDDAPPYPPEEP
jgi:ParB-like chromosome segregation protein Spo0J